MSDNNRDIFIEDEIKRSYLNYSMSVIVGRALPDIRDGLKPVHRRILYSMNENGMTYSKPFKKCARIVGDVLGKYHPHGIEAVYQSLVRMAQDFNMNYPLVEGQGNFGSVDGDPPAAMRYTEAKMSKLSSELIMDIDKDTIEFRKNFDETLEEPIVLPSKIPNLLLNGSSGIAVGMATNIPPHNLSEICDASIAYIEKMDITSEELTDYLKGPDFPTGGLIFGREGMKDAYNTGRGKVRVRGRAEIVENSNGSEAIIITELPYQVNKANLIQSIANLVKERKIEGISDLRDESDRDGIRVFIEIKKNEDAAVVLNKLYKYTSLENTFGIIMLALVDNIPKVLSLKELISNHVSHRFTIVKRRTEFELKRAEARLHILEGFKIAVINIDEVVAIIKGSEDSNDAKNKLKDRFNLSDIQAKSILEMRLSKLTGLEIKKLDDEIASLDTEISNFKNILSKEENIYRIVKDEFEYLKNTYGTKRRSEIVDDVQNISIEDMISDDDVLITITNKGYVKRISLETYKAQNRGGKGYIGQTLSEEDFLRTATYAKNLDTLLLFTNKGKVYSIKVYDLPELNKNSKGRLFSNIVPLEIGERVKSIIKTRDMEEEKDIAFITRSGIVKKTKLSLYNNINKSGIIALKLRDGDDLVNALLLEKEDKLFLATRDGYGILFKASDIRSVGRSSYGVMGIRLRKDDRVISAVSINTDSSLLLTISEKGFGKKSKINSYNSITRGGKGVKNMKITDKTGKVVSVEDVKNDDELILITSKGSIIRTEVKNISTIGRVTQGVKIMSLRKDETVVDIAKLRF
jgi:DNA gyrase subunit A